VDPTKIFFPANLTGIVGPNGCGKSNVIDAVRWVMGESSAKHLRGASMDDVIFSGSSSRSPVGQAQVELVFDNSQDKAQGEYAKFNEISVKRLVSRDGQSKYFLNGTKCRRRDIADLFLGTGLGPRSYAIIEQGMISRIIDAKPEELRVYFEEAAGISKYKERRRETANRIKHTRENLERLTDLREEVEKQIKRLDRQAKTADKYKTLKAEQRRTSAELLLLQRAQFKQTFEKVDAQVQALETKNQKALSGLRETEAELEKIRQKLITANEQHNVVQGDFYRIGSDISSQEQLLVHQKQQLAKNKESVKKADDTLTNKRNNLNDNGRLQQELTQKLELLLPEIEQTSGQKEALITRLNEAEQTMTQWQIRWDSFNKEYHEKQQSAQVENKTIEHLERQVSQLEKRLNNFDEELKSLDSSIYDDEIESLSKEVSAYDKDMVEHQKLAVEQQNTITTLRESIAQSEHILDEKRNQVQTLRGTLSSLKTLQEDALNSTSNTFDDWLKQQNLASAKRLSDVIMVDNGFEKQAETILGGCLTAYCTPSIDSIYEPLKAISDDKVEIIDTASSATKTLDNQQNWTLLSSKIKSDYDIDSLIGAVYLCDDDQLIQRRSELASNQSLITPQGVWCGPNWIKQLGTNAHDGVLQRDKDIKRINKELEEITESALTIKEGLDKEKETLIVEENKLSEIQSNSHQLQKRSSNSQQTLAAKKLRQQQVVERQKRINTDSINLHKEATELATDLKKSTQKRNDDLLLINELNNKRNVISNEKEDFSNALKVVRDEQRENSDQLHRLKIKQQAVQSELKSTEQNIQRIKNEEQQLKLTLSEAQLAIEGADQPIIDLETSLQKLLENKNSLTLALQQSQNAVADLDTQQRGSEAKRVELNHQIDEIRTHAEAEKLKAQEIKVRITTLDEQLAETDFHIDSLLKSLDATFTINTHQQQLDELNRRINQLGQINLAAIEQFAEETQRKKYLDDQNEDLNKSLDTLESAIKKIDRETKDRFKEIFDQVNERMKLRFPKLFGGGEAHLELTENDLLTTGVVIMARPPGKRVNSLQLLSGGEKALTAVALIFAIFELNPSPFCMLDEVDAPLDDANVGRFCSMVKEMSDQVQFVFISHNKITMELAENLNGVTMHEPGVSRLVTVDLKEAEQLIETNTEK
ncbi:MAG: chromosome segregation protein SMC, partial [Gammaproteobacteria bacterium]|nr:chromosome segregation protein SMC [Gammaproteobacteria bacterium]